MSCGNPKTFSGMFFSFLFLFLFYIENNNKGKPEGKKQYHFFENAFPQEIFSPTWPKAAKAGQIGPRSLNLCNPMCYKTPKTSKNFGHK